MATPLPGSPSSAASRGESARCRTAHADGLRHDEDATSSEDAAEETRTSIIRAPSWQLQGAIKHGLAENHEKRAKLPQAELS